MNDRLIIGYDAKRIVRNGTGLGSYGRTLVNDIATDDALQLRLYAPDEGRAGKTCATRLSTVRTSPSATRLTPSFLSIRQRGGQKGSCRTCVATTYNYSTGSRENFLLVSVKAVSRAWSRSTT